MPLIRRAGEGGHVAFDNVILVPQSRTGLLGCGFGIDADRANIICNFPGLYGLETPGWLLRLTCNRDGSGIDCLL